jgi:hypothetical protein
MAAEQHTNVRVDRACTSYRRLLVAYPRTFRDEFGDDLVQAFRDLLLMSGERGVWWRTVRDLFVSAPREHVAAMREGKRPSPWLFALLLVLLVPAVLTGGVLPELYVMIGCLLVLPVIGINRLHRAFIVRRTTGGAILGLVTLGVACFIPGVAFLVLAGPDRSWLIGATVVLALVVGSALAIVGGVAALITARRSGEPVPQRAFVGAGVAVLVMGGLISAAYISYRNTQPPPGDHSVANASAETRALWTAADTGDVETVKRLAQTCADPWVQFPTPDGKHNARGAADARLLDLPDDQEPPYAEIMKVLGPAQSSWYDRCGASAAEK